MKKIFFLFPVLLLAACSSPEPEPADEPVEEVVFEEDKLVEERAEPKVPEPKKEVCSNGAEPLESLASEWERVSPDEELYARKVYRLNGFEFEIPGVYSDYHAFEHVEHPNRLDFAMTDNPICMNVPTEYGPALSWFSEEEWLVINEGHEHEHFENVSFPEFEAHAYQEESFGEQVRYLEFQLDNWFFRTAYLEENEDLVLGLLESLKSLEKAE